MAIGKYAVLHGEGSADMVAIAHCRICISHHVHGSYVMQWLICLEIVPTLACYV